jgi:hypothetical protein
MRVARGLIEGHEEVLLEHGGALYRVALLDEFLGAPLPTDLLARSLSFETRVFGLALAGLDDHDAALADGTRLGDAALLGPPLLLPPCGARASILELPAGQRGDLTLALRGATLRGPGAPVADPQGGPLLVAPALAYVLGDDLVNGDPAAAARAIAGRCLGLAWSSARLEREGRLAGLGPGPGREIGSHLGPWLATDEPAGDPRPVEIELRCGDNPSLLVRMNQERDRVARALARAARLGPILAGDVLLLVSPERLTVEPGQTVTAAAAGLGVLRG